MNIYDATEIAYTNGYNQALKDFAERVKEEFKIDKFFLDQICEEMIRRP